MLFNLTPASSTTPCITPTINPSDFYFITETIAEDDSKTAVWGWQQNNESPTPQAGYLSEFGGNPWFGETGITPAFTVSGNPISSAVPEPRSYAALLAAAFVGMLILGRRLRVSL